jgi:hypothetical protein
MNLPLRITFEGTDYTYRVLTKAINKDITEIKINFADQEFTLVKSQTNEWIALEVSVGDNPALLKAIGRAVASRYRLK